MAEIMVGQTHFGKRRRGDPAVYTAFSHHAEHRSHIALNSLIEAYQSSSCGHGRIQIHDWQIKGKRRLIHKGHMIHSRLLSQLPRPLCKISQIIRRNFYAFGFSRTSRCKDDVIDIVSRYRPYMQSVLIAFAYQPDSGRSDNLKAIHLERFGG